MSETAGEISRNKLIIHKYFDRGSQTKDISALHPDNIGRQQNESRSDKIKASLDDLMIPSEDKTRQFLEKESVGINEIVKHVAVQADILSKRSGGNDDVKKSYEKFVDTVINKGITSRDEINSLTFEREERQNQKFVVESEEIIKDLDKYIEEVSEVLSRRIPQEEAANFDIIYLQEKKQRLITLSAQIKDEQAIKRIEESISGIQGIIKKVMYALQQKVEESAQKSEDEDSFTLEPGKYEAYLELPIKRGKNYYNLEIYTLELNNELLEGQIGEVDHKPYKVGDCVVKVSAGGANGKRITAQYKLPEVVYLNEGLGKDGFIKLSSR